MVESQPLFGRTMAWRSSAATGLVARGETDLESMRGVQPWPTGRATFQRARPAATA
jgi:hypothetical protein